MPEEKKMEWDLEMAGKYLDRDAVLKALEKTRDWPAYTIAEFQEAVKHGKFDANPTPFGREWMREQDIVVAEKDAEIARLSKTIDEIMNDNLHMRVEIERKIQEIERLNEKYNESCADKEALAEVIRKLSNALASEKWVNEDLKEACEEHEREIARLKSRIADLEKLCDVQKTTIDAQGKEIAEPETSQKKVIDGVVLHGIATLSGNIPVCNTREHIIIHDVDYVVVQVNFRYDMGGNPTTNTTLMKFSDFSEKYYVGNRKEPAQKEPELFICTGQTGESWMPCMGCTHGHPHKHNEDCMKWPVRCVSNSKPCKCVPVKASNPQPSPVPTSGTGTAPASGTVSGVGGMTGADIERISQSGARILPPDKKDGHYPGMAKDIGDLFPRVNKIEQLLKDYPLKTLYERQVAYRLERLESDSKQDREIEGLVQKHLMDDSRLNSQENHIDRVETALKALQEEVAGIKKNQILSTYDPTPRTFTTTVSDQYTQTGSYNPCQNCQTLAEFNRQHPNGYVGDGYPCNLCPNNPGRVACSK